MDALWACAGVREFFAQREASASLEEMILLSSMKGPLSTFPPSVNENVYCDLISFGLAHSKGIISFLLNLLVKKDKPVEPKDTVRVAFMFSLLAYNMSRDNCALAKTKGLLMESQGLTVQGIDMLHKLGISETGRSILNQTDMLAEVGDSLLRSTSRSTCSQATMDNLDMMDQHMTINFIEPEKINTSHLDTDKMTNSEIADLFKMKLVLMEDAENSAEQKHFKKLVGNSVGRLMAKLVEKV